MPLPLRVRLLGGFDLYYGDMPIRDVNKPRLQSLLTYLVLHAGSLQSRQHVAFLFWPDIPEAHARNNLRQLLHQARQTLPEAARFLIIDAQTVGWQCDQGQAIDVQTYQHALSEADDAVRRSDAGAEQTWLQRAVTAYQGDLVPACYDEWIAPERDRLRQQCCVACQKLVNLLENQREYAAALETTQQLLRLDPLDESTYVALMRLHELTGDGAGAQRVYQTAVKTLQRELGVAPSVALVEAHARSQQSSHVAPAPRADTASIDTSLKLVGRRAQWQQLHAAWQRSESGSPHLVLIRGEAGIGKSRLAAELYNWAGRQGYTTAYARSYGAEGRLSLAPATEWLRSDALRPHLARLDRVWLTEIARLLPELLSATKNLARPEPIAEYGRRQRFFEALARGVLVAPHPILLWIDDLQWCDQETLEWLHFLLRFAVPTPLLIVGTAREEELLADHPVSMLARQLQLEDRLDLIDLSPLDAAETAHLAGQIQGQALDLAAILALYRETEGNPLFVVETIRAAMTGAVTPSAVMPVEPDAASVAPNFNAHKLPARVHAVIAGRLAQLSPTARKVAEVGAAIGRAFTLDLLLQAGFGDEESVVHALDELWQRRIVREQGANVLDFTHDKLRDVVYAEISAPHRRYLHRRIAQALEAYNGENPDPVSGEIAAQYEQAGMFAQAIPFYQRAGMVAASVYANETAIRLFTRGLALLETLPPSATRDAQELAIQLALARLYRLTLGWAAPEAERAILRTVTLSEGVGTVDQRIQSLMGLQSLYVVQAELQKVEHAYAQAEKLFRAKNHTAPPPFAGIHCAGAQMFMGRFIEASAWFEAIIAVPDDKHIRDLQEVHGLNYLVHGLAWNAHALWCLGYAQSALTQAYAAIELAPQFAQPFNRALAISYLALLQEWRADAGTFRACAEHAYALTSETETHYYRAWSGILTNFAQAWQRPDAESLARLRSAIDVFTQTGARVRLPVYQSQLARACWRARGFDEGLEVLEQALAETQQNQEHWWDAELYRLRGVLRWSQGADHAEVEAAFRDAIEIAQAQQARLLELRAAISLTRLWQADGQRVAARQLLAPIYGWFVEGFDTPDLQTAHALLARL